MGGGGCSWQVSTELQRACRCAGASCWAALLLGEQIAQRGLVLLLCWFFARRLAPGGWRRSNLLPGRRFHRLHSAKFAWFLLGHVAWVEQRFSAAFAQSQYSGFNR